MATQSNTVLLSATGSWSISGPGAVSTMGSSNDSIPRFSSISFTLSFLPFSRVKTTTLDAEYPMHSAGMEPGVQVCCLNDFE